MSLAESQQLEVAKTSVVVMIDLVRTRDSLKRCEFDLKTATILYWVMLLLAGS